MTEPRWDVLRAEEVEFDVDPNELLDQADLDVLIDFVSTIGRELHRPVYVGIESGDPRPPEDMRYDPMSDRVIARD